MNWVFVIAHQNGSTLGEPGEGAFHDPTPWRISSLVLGHDRFAFAPNVPNIAMLGDDVLSGGRVIGLIQAQMLGAFLLGSWPVHDNGFECLL